METKDDILEKMSHNFDKLKELGVKHTVLMEYKDYAEWHSLYEKQSSISISKPNCVRCIYFRSSAILRDILEQIEEIESEMAQLVELNKSYLR